MGPTGDPPHLAPQYQGQITPEPGPGPVCARSVSIPFLEFCERFWHTLRRGAATDRFDMLAPRRSIPAFLLCLTALVSCAPVRDTAPAPLPPAPVPAPVSLSVAAQPSARPAARWDHLDSGALWTRAALRALDGPAARLPQSVPADVSAWCPQYPVASVSDRKAFWVGLISSLAKHESTWRPGVSGGEGRWHGLLQISPATARGYGCRAATAEALKDGPANLRCGLRIMAQTVARDGVVARKGGGVAADWGPFSQPQKRADIQAWVRRQSYCQA